MRYLRVFLVLIWMFIAFGLGFLKSLFSWGDLNTNKFTARLFGKYALKILGVRLQTEGFEKLEAYQPCVYLANHQGALDILTFGSLYPANSVVIAKKEIAWIPVLNLFYIGAGNILIDRKKKQSAHASIARAIEAVRQKKASVWLFPEGTRNRKRDVETILPLKKGAFHLAVESQIRIVPIVSGPIAHVVDWKKGVLKPGVVRLKVLPPIETQGLTAADIDRLADQTRAAMIEAVHGLEA